MPFNLEKYSRLLPAMLSATLIMGCEPTETEKRAIEAATEKRRQEFENCLYQTIWQTEVDEHIGARLSSEQFPLFSKNTGTIDSALEKEVKAFDDFYHSLYGNQDGLATTKNETGDFEINYDQRCQGEVSPIKYQTAENIRKTRVEAYRDFLISRHDLNKDGEVDRVDFELCLAQEDLNQDGVIDRTDKEMGSLDLAWPKVKSASDPKDSWLVSSLNIDDGPYSLPIEQIGDREVPLDFGSINQIVREKDLSPEYSSHLALSRLDVNTDSVISRADDYNMDGFIDQRDFEEIRAFKAALAEKYGADFSPELVSPMDVIVYNLDHHGSFAEDIRQVDPLTNGFPAYHRSDLVRRDESKSVFKIKVGERTVGGVGRGTFMGGAGGALVGHMFGLSGGGLLSSTLVGAGLGTRDASTETIYETHETKRQIEYFVATNEINETVKTLVLTAGNGYKVFYFDSATVIEEEFMHKVADEYVNGRLKSHSEELESVGHMARKEQKTSRRILVLDPDRNIKVIFIEPDYEGFFGRLPKEDLKFIALFNGMDAGQDLLRGEEPTTLTKPFRSAFMETRGAIVQAYDVADGFHNFNPVEALKREETYLKYRGTEQ